MFIEVMGFDFYSEFLVYLDIVMVCVYVYFNELVEEFYDMYLEED